MEYVLVSIVNLICFVVGAIVGQKSATKEKIISNPIKAIEKHLEEKEIKIEEDKYKTILSNIDNYDGTGLGQQDI